MPTAPAPRQSVPDFLRAQRAWLPDALERAGRAGGSAALAVLGLSSGSSVTDLAALSDLAALPWWAAALVGVGTALGSLGLSVLARWRGDSGSASFRE